MLESSCSSSSVTSDRAERRARANDRGGTSRRDLRRCSRRRPTGRKGSPGRVVDLVRCETRGRTERGRTGGSPADLPRRSLWVLRGTSDTTGIGRSSSSSSSALNFPQEGGSGAFFKEVGRDVVSLSHGEDQPSAGRVAKSRRSTKPTKGAGSAGCHRSSSRQGPCLANLYSRVYRGPPWSIRISGAGTRAASKRGLAAIHANGRGTAPANPQTSSPVGANDGWRKWEELRRSDPTTPALGVQAGAARGLPELVEPKRRRILPEPSGRPDAARVLCVRRRRQRSASEPGPLRRSGRPRRTPGTTHAAFDLGGSFSVDPFGDRLDIKRRRCSPARPSADAGLIERRAWSATYLTWEHVLGPRAESLAFRLAELKASGTPAASAVAAIASRCSDLPRGRPGRRDARHRALTTTSSTTTSQSFSRSGGSGFSKKGMAVGSPAKVRIVTNVVSNTLTLTETLTGAPGSGVVVYASSRFTRANSGPEDDDLHREARHEPRVTFTGCKVKVKIEGVDARGRRSSRSRSTRRATRAPRRPRSRRPTSPGSPRSRRRS